MKLNPVALVAFVVLAGLSAGPGRRSGACESEARSKDEQLAFGHQAARPCFALRTRGVSSSLPGQTVSALARSDEGKDVKETALDAPNKVKIKVRMEGPYTADVPLQVVCYFKYTPDGAKRMGGAPVELDKRLGGAIGALRERGQFVGDELETLLILPPKDSIKAKALLLVGLGEEDALSLKVMEGVGRVALREAARLGVNRVAFAPLIRDQGNKKLGTGDVETAVVRGMLLAYDTEKRLQKEGLAKEFTLADWNVEAGPDYFDDTVLGVQKAIDQANKAIKDRSADPLLKGK